MEKTTVPGKFIDLNMMENVLNEQFGNDYRVKVCVNCLQLVKKVIN